jgi:hypothetical protein
MKRSNYIFESVLIAITAVLGFAALFSFDATILGALWLIVLGTLQVVHSLILGASYWSNEAIQKSIIIYWCGVALNFSVMLIGNVITHSDNIEIATILIFPLILALYLWYITYTCRVKPMTEVTFEKV